MLGCSLLSREPSPGVAAQGLGLSCTLLNKGRAALFSPVFPFKPQQQRQREQPLPWNIYELLAEVSGRASGCVSTLPEQRARKVIPCDCYFERCLQWSQALDKCL